MFRLLYSLYGIVHAMACLPPAVGAHPSGIPNNLFPIVSQVVLPFLAVLSDPEWLWQQPLVQALAGRVGFTEAVASP